MIQEPLAQACHSALSAFFILLIFTHSGHLLTPNHISHDGADDAIVLGLAGSLCCHSDRREAQDNGEVGTDTACTPPPTWEGGRGRGREGETDGHNSEAPLPNVSSQIAALSGRVLLSVMNT